MSRTSRALAALFASGLAIVSLAHCGSSGDGDAPTSANNDAAAAGSVSVVVGASGGTVATADGNASIEVPAGALPADTTLTIAPSPPSTPAPPDAATVGTSYTFGPSGLVFLKPITLKLAFDPAAVARVNATASAVVALTAPDGSAAYVALPTTLVDAAHIATTTTHFTTYVAAVEMDDAGPVTDAASDAGSACYVECGVTGDAAEGGTEGCTCQSRCGGHAYATMCVSGSCTCTTDGVTTGNTTVGACGDGSGALGSYHTGCGYSGVVLPPSTCPITCNFQVDAGSDADPDAGETITSCDCASSCSGHTNTMTCNGTTCACNVDGVTTESWPDVPACSDPIHAFHYDCHFVGGLPVGDDE